MQLDPVGGGFDLFCEDFDIFLGFEGMCGSSSIVGEWWKADQGFLCFRGS